LSLENNNYLSQTSDCALLAKYRMKFGLSVEQNWQQNHGQCQKLIFGKFPGELQSLSGEPFDVETLLITFKNANHRRAHFFNSSTDAAGLKLEIKQC
jgi:hypothetical protein